MPKNLENASEFRLFVYELTESKSFGAFVLFIILLNTVILVVQTDEGISIKAGKKIELIFVKNIVLRWRDFRENLKLYFHYSTKILRHKKVKNFTNFWMAIIRKKGDGMLL